MNVSSYIIKEAEKCKARILNISLAEKCFQNIMSPDDGKKWPYSWRKSETRVKRILAEKECEYWRAFVFIREEPLFLIQEWNKLVRLPMSKRVRVLGRYVKLNHISSKSKFLWDMVVLKYILKGEDLINCIEKVLKQSKVEVLYPKYLWKAIKNRPDLFVAKKEKDDKDWGISVIKG